MSFCFTVFLFCLHFYLLSHFKIIRCNVKSFTPTSMHFLQFIATSTEKRKLEKCFLGARVWAPKPVYQFPKQPEYITGGTSLFSLQYRKSHSFELFENILHEFLLNIIFCFLIRIHPMQG